MSMNSSTESLSQCSTTPPPISIPLLPQELKDAILHHLASSPTTLAACALAHRTLTPTAQSLLFHTLYITRPTRAPALRRLLHSAPHLAAHPRRLIIRKLVNSAFWRLYALIPHYAESPKTLMIISDMHVLDDARNKHWIATAAPDLATVLATLPNLEALALRCAMTSFPYLGDLRYALRRVVLKLRVLELAGIRLMPPDLIAGGQLVSLRLVDMSFAGQAGSQRAAACAPEALELVIVSPRALSALRLDVRCLTRLRLDLAGPETAALVPLCASTLRMLQVDSHVLPPRALPALHTLALRAFGDDGESVRPWLRAAPTLRRLVLWSGGDESSCETRIVGGGIEVWGRILLSGDVLREGHTLERVELVWYENDKTMRGPTLPRDARVGVLEGGVEVVRVWIRRPDRFSGEPRASILGSDILHG
ncbi:hypothetical protein GGG16DRAFT_52156 [Schizophyllum commune]